MLVVEFIIMGWTNRSCCRLALFLWLAVVAVTVLWLLRIAPLVALLVLLLDDFRCGAWPAPLSVAMTKLVVLVGVTALALFRMGVLWCLLLREDDLRADGDVVLVLLRMVPVLALGCGTSASLLLVRCFRWPRPRRIPSQRVSLPFCT